MLLYCVCLCAVACYTVNETWFMHCVVYMFIFLAYIKCVCSCIYFNERSLLVVIP